jgi:hypothetical protein
MTIREIEDLLEETRKLSRASDKAQLNMAMGVLEIARQLAMLNEQLGSRPPAAAKTAGKKK